MKRARTLVLMFLLTAGTACSTTTHAGPFVTNVKTSADGRVIEIERCDVVVQSTEIGFVLFLYGQTTVGRENCSHDSPTATATSTSPSSTSPTQKK